MSPYSLLLTLFLLLLAQSTTHAAAASPSPSSQASAAAATHSSSSSQAAPSQAAPSTPSSSSPSSSPSLLQQRTTTKTTQGTVAATSVNAHAKQSEHHRFMSLVEQMSLSIDRPRKHRQHVISRIVNEVLAEVSSKQSSQFAADSDASEINFTLLNSLMEKQAAIKFSDQQQQDKDKLVGIDRKALNKIADKAIKNALRSVHVSPSLLESKPIRMYGVTPLARSSTDSLYELPASQLSDEQIFALEDPILNRNMDLDINRNDNVKQAMEHTKPKVVYQLNKDQAHEIAAQEVEANEQYLQKQKDQRAQHIAELAALKAKRAARKQAATPAASVAPASAATLSFSSASSPKVSSAAKKGDSKTAATAEARPPKRRIRTEPLPPAAPLIRTSKRKKGGGKSIKKSGVGKEKQDDNNDKKDDKPSTDADKTTNAPASSQTTTETVNAPTFLETDLHVSDEMDLDDASTPSSSPLNEKDEVHPSLRIPDTYDFEYLQQQLLIELENSLQEPHDPAHEEIIQQSTTASSSLKDLLSNHGVHKASTYASQPLRAHDDYYSFVEYHGTDEFLPHRNKNKPVENKDVKFFAAAPVQASATSFLETDVQYKQSDAPLGLKELGVLLGLGPKKKEAAAPAATPASSTDAAKPAAATSLKQAAQTARFQQTKGKAHAQAKASTTHRAREEEEEGGDEEEKSAPGEEGLDAMVDAGEAYHPDPLKHPPPPPVPPPPPPPPPPAQSEAGGEE